MTILGDDLEAVEVRPHLWYVVDDGGDAEERGVAAIVLEMPEEEGEDEADPDPHDPGHQHEHQQPDVGEGLGILSVTVIWIFRTNQP